MLTQLLRDLNVKHDIAAIDRHKTKQCEQFCFNTMSVTVSDGTFIMLAMSLTFSGRESGGRGIHPPIMENFPLLCQQKG